MNPRENENAAQPNPHTRFVANAERSILKDFGEGIDISIDAPQALIRAVLLCARMLGVLCDQLDDLISEATASGS